MNASSKKNKNRSKRRRRNEPNILLPTLIAAGTACGIAAAPASAIELGDVTVQSALGQPLRASVAYAMNPNEQLHAFCIYLKPGTASSGMRFLSKATVSVTNSSIVFSGSTPVREPMMAMQVSIDCPYTARLARDYTLMFDPAMLQAAPNVRLASSTPPLAATPIAATPIAATPDTSAPAQPRSRPTVAIDRSPIAQATNYQVQSGDSLSEIAARIENRSIALWPAVDALFAANPDAFIDNDVNRLRAGSMLQIPDFAQAASTSPSAIATVATVVNSQDSVATAPAETVDHGSVANTVAVSEAAIDASIDPVDDTATLDAGVTVADGATDSAAPVVSGNELQPGDVVLDGENPFVTPIDNSGQTSVANEPEIIIADTQIDVPATSVPVASSAGSSRTGTGGSWTWLFWLGGIGIALIAGLLLFGRRLRGKFAAAARGVSAGIGIEREKTDITSKKTPPAVGLQIADKSDAGTMSPDADLGSGGGLQGGATSDVAEDLGSSTDGYVNPILDPEMTDLDIAITHDASAKGEEDTVNVSIAGLLVEETILDSEVPPRDVDGEYDLSMIADATKQAIGDKDETVRSVLALQMESENAVDENNMHTLSKEIDHRILERDNEEEMTATQALDAEIDRAALDLAERMADVDAVESTAVIAAVDDTPANIDDTGKLPQFSEAADDVNETAQMPEVSENPAAGNETAEVAAVNVSDTAEVPTVSDPAVTTTPASETHQAGDSDAELTTALPAHSEAENEDFADLDDTSVAEKLDLETAQDGDDLTVEIEIESGTIDTKDIKAS